MVKWLLLAIASINGLVPATIKELASFLGGNEAIMKNTNLVVRFYMLQIRLILAAVNVQVQCQ